MPADEELIGPIMRVLWQEARDRIHRHLDAEGYEDIRAEHFAVLQYPGPDGERPSVLAARAGLSRQAMNQLLGHLERGGYLGRETVGGRANVRVVRLTSRGQELLRQVKSAVAALEREWADDIGGRRLEELRTVLIELRARRQAN